MIGMIIGFVVLVMFQVLIVWYTWKLKRIVEEMLVHWVEMNQEFYESQKKILKQGIQNLELTSKYLRDISTTKETAKIITNNLNEINKIADSLRDVSKTESTTNKTITSSVRNLNAVVEKFKKWSTEKQKGAK